MRKVQGDSNTTDVQKTAKDQTFEIRLYLKYTRSESVEEADRIATENEMLRVLEDADIEPTGIIYFENKSWQTSIIDDAIYGSKSVLRFTVKDISSTSGSGLIGSGDKIELNSQTVPLQIQVLGLSTESGFSMDTHTTDDGIVIYDPNSLINLGEFTVTYEQTDSIKAVVDALSTAGTATNCKIIRGANETKLTLHTGRTTTNGSYGEYERATTRFYAVGTWI